MKDWIVTELMYFGSNWLDLLLGGLVVTSVVIFLMGILKKACVNKIKNKLIRKIVLSWSSLLIVLPVTAASIFYNGSSTEHFWGMYIINCVLTIVMYWLYENTALRDSLGLVGKSVLSSMFKANTTKETQAIITDAEKEIKDLLMDKSQHKYKDDDLNNV